MFQRTATGPRWNKVIEVAISPEGDSTSAVSAALAEVESQGWLLIAVVPIMRGGWTVAVQIFFRRIA